MSWKVAFPFISSGVLGVQSANRLMVERAIKGLHAPPYKVEGEPISAIVCTHNEEDYLGNCLRSIQNQTYYPIEIVVVDYESEDRTREIARGFTANVLCATEPGVGNARDLGAKDATANYLFFTDADVIHENLVVEELARDMENGWDVVTVQPVLFDTSNPVLILGHNVARFRASWVLSGRATLLHRSAWESVGGWELPYGEERHFGRKLLDAGYRMRARRDLAVATSARLWYGRSRAVRLKGLLK